MELSFAGTHNEDGSFDETGVYFSYNYNFQMKIPEGDDGMDPEPSAAGTRRGLLANQCNAPNVVSAIQLALAGTMPWW